MADRDLIAAIRNAADRGESVENAISSLVNAGYPKQDVEDAGKEIKMGQSVLNQSMPHSNAKKSFFNPMPKPVNVNPVQKPKSNKNIIIAAIILLGLIAVGIITFFVMKFL